MYNIITERNLREALESIPAQYTVDMEKDKAGLDIVQVEECISVRCWPRGKKVWKRQLNCITI